MVLIEAVTSHGPIDAQRRAVLHALFSIANTELVFVTAFLTAKDLARYTARIAWETDAWLAESPSHLIHFDGDHL